MKKIVFFLIQIHLHQSVKKKKSSQAYFSVMYIFTHNPPFCFDFQSGSIVPVSVKVGDKVLLPEYGGTKVSMEEKVWIYLLF